MILVWGNLLPRPVCVLSRPRLHPLVVPCAGLRCFRSQQWVQDHQGSPVGRQQTPGSGLWVVFLGGVLQQPQSLCWLFPTVHQGFPQCAVVPGAVGGGC